MLNRWICLHWDTSLNRRVCTTMTPLCYKRLCWTRKCGLQFQYAPSSAPSNGRFNLMRHKQWIMRIRMEINRIIQRTQFMCCTKKHAMLWFRMNSFNHSYVIFVAWLTLARSMVECVCRHFLQAKGAWSLTGELNQSDSPSKRFDRSYPNFLHQNQPCVHRLLHSI